jgi:hypothetical protein
MGFLALIVFFPPNTKAFFRFFVIPAGDRKTAQQVPTSFQLYIPILYPLKHHVPAFPTFPAARFEVASS